jgi:hypothetical protein
MSTCERSEGMARASMERTYLISGSSSFSCGHSKRKEEEGRGGGKEEE